MSDHEARIRELAYRLWEQAGRPEGQDELYWSEAETHLAAGSDVARGPEASKPASSADRPAKAEPKAVAKAERTLPSKAALKAEPKTASKAAAKLAPKPGAAAKNGSGAKP